MKRRPKTSTTCPLCKESVGIVAGLKALTPFFMRCLNCRVLLRVRMPGMFLYVSALVVLLGLVVLSVPIVKATFGINWRIGFTILWVGLGLVADVATSVLFFTYATFTTWHVRLPLRR